MEMRQAQGGVARGYSPPNTEAWRQAAYRVMVSAAPAVHQKK
jgi:hypothetical protein